MAEIKNIEINFQTNADQVKNQVDGLSASTDKLNGSNESITKSNIKLTESSNKVTSSLSKSTDAISKNGGAMGLLNAATGGMAQTFKDAYEASDLFGSGMSGKVLGSIKKFSTGAKVALASTGIGLLVVATGLLVAYWDDLVGLVSGVTSEMKKNGEIAQANVDIEKSKLDFLNSQDNILKLQGKTEKEIIKIKQEQTKEVIKGLEAQILGQIEMKRSQVETSKRNKEILSGILLYLTAPLSILLATVDLVGKALGKDFGLIEKFTSITSLIFDPEEVAAEGDATIKETQKQLDILKNTEAGYQLSIKAIDKEGADKRREAQKAIDDQKLKDKEESLKKLVDLEKRYLNDIATLNTKTEQQQLDLNKAKEQADLDAIVLSADAKINAQKLLDEKYAILQKELDDKKDSDNLAGLTALLEKRQLIETEFNTLKTATDVEDLRVKRENELIAREEADIVDATLLGASEEELNSIRAYYTEQKVINDKDASEATIAIAEKEKAARLATINAIQTGLGLATEALGESTAAGKVAAVASATISTYQSAVDSYKGMVSAIPGPVGIAAGAVAAAASVAMGIANVKKILAVKIPKGGAGGSVPTGVGAQATVAPSVSFVASSENQIAGSVQRQQQDNGPIRAYVVGREMTSQQEYDRNVDRLTSIG